MAPALRQREHRKSGATSSIASLMMRITVSRCSKTHQLAASFQLMCTRLGRHPVPTGMAVGLGAAPRYHGSKPCALLLCYPTISPGSHWARLSSTLFRKEVNSTDWLHCLWQDVFYQIVIFEAMIASALCARHMLPILHQPENDNKIICYYIVRSVVNRLCCRANVRFTSLRWWMFLVGRYNLVLAWYDCYFLLV